MIKNTDLPRELDSAELVITSGLFLYVPSVVVKISSGFSRNTLSLTGDEAILKADTASLCDIPARLTPFTWLPWQQQLALIQQAVEEWSTKKKPRAIFKRTHDLIMYKQRH